jgi:hypothetical protein
VKVRSLGLGCSSVSDPALSSTDPGFDPQHQNNPPSQTKARAFPQSPCCSWTPIPWPEGSWLNLVRRKEEAEAPNDMANGGFGSQTLPLSFKPEPNSKEDILGPVK